jgi:hypothetical protein
VRRGRSPPCQCAHETMNSHSRRQPQAFLIPQKIMRPSILNMARVNGGPAKMWWLIFEILRYVQTSFVLEPKKIGEPNKHFFMTSLGIHLMPLVLDVGICTYTAATKTQKIQLSKRVAIHLFFIIRLLPLFRQHGSVLPLLL